MLFAIMKSDNYSGAVEFVNLLLITIIYNPFFSSFLTDLIIPRILIVFFSGWFVLR
jgi:hypothetical protein